MSKNIIINGINKILPSTHDVALRLHKSAKKEMISVSIFPNHLQYRQSETNIFLLVKTWININEMGFVHTT